MRISRDTRDQIIGGVALIAALCVLIVAWRKSLNLDMASVVTGSLLGISGGLWLDVWRLQRARAAINLQNAKLNATVLKNQLNVAAAIRSTDAMIGIILTLPQLASLHAAVRFGSTLFIECEIRTMTSNVPLEEIEKIVLAHRVNLRIFASVLKIDQELEEYLHLQDGVKTALDAAKLLFAFYNLAKATLFERYGVVTARAFDSATLLAHYSVMGPEASDSLALFASRLVKFGFTLTFARWISYAGTKAAEAEMMQPFMQMCEAILQNVSSFDYDTKARAEVEALANDCANLETSQMWDQLAWSFAVIADRWERVEKEFFVDLDSK